MSDIPADYREQLNLRVEIARIDRDRAETHKLISEARKFDRDRWWAPVAVLAAAMTAGGAVLGAGVLLGRLLWLHQ